MPQTSPEIRDLMSLWFGVDEPADYAAIKFLESHGYILKKGWIWDKPTSAHWMSHEEYMCLRYLIEEWDFGGIDGPKAA